LVNTLQGRPAERPFPPRHVDTPSGFEEKAP
jgi:hypothetical protein